MTGKELKLVVRTLSKPRKLEVIEENMFDQGNDCYQTFKKTGSLQAASRACYSYNVVRGVIRDSIKYGAAMVQN